MHVIESKDLCFQENLSLNAVQHIMHNEKYKTQHKLSWPFREQLQELHTIQDSPQS